jgi:predicted acyltransferase
MSESIVINPPLQPKKRVESIDAFRGFTILAMIFVIQVAGYRNLPLTLPHFNSAPVSTFKHAGEDSDAEEWAFWEGKPHSTIYRKAKILERLSNTRYNVTLLDEKGTPEKTFNNVLVTHAKPLRKDDGILAIKQQDSAMPEFRGYGNGCTFTDLVAPFFVFIVGVCIPLSKQRRGAAWWKHVGTRTLLLILAGVIYISLVLKTSYWWGILQAIGVAYFMGAALMRFSAIGRWLAVAIIAIFHGYMSWHYSWWLELGDKSRPFLTVVNTLGDPLRPLTVHCTPWGSISYGLCTVVGTLLGDAIVSRKHKTIIKQCLLIGIVFTVVGYLLHIYQAPINKDYVSPSYSIFTSGIAALTFLIFYLIIDVGGFKVWALPLNVYGSNALLAYFMQPVVRIFVIGLGFYGFLDGLSGWHGVWGGLLWTALLWCVVLWCNKKNIYWRL